jgi:hypothetical protein
MLRKLTHAVAAVAALIGITFAAVGWADTDTAQEQTRKHTPANFAPFADSPVYLASWKDGVVGASAAHLRLYNFGTYFEASGDMVTFGDGANYLSVFYNTDDCSFGENRAGHIGHGNWVTHVGRYGEAVPNSHRRLNVHIDRELSAVKSISIRRYFGTPGQPSNPPEDDSNTELLACYSRTNGGNLNVTGR